MRFREEGGEQTLELSKRSWRWMGSPDRIWVDVASEERQSFGGRKLSGQKRRQRR